MSITSDEVNYLVYRYLQESGFQHSAFALSNESLLHKTAVDSSEVPPGALITLLQKGLQYVEVEWRFTEDGTEIETDEHPTLLSALSTRNERKKRDRKDPSAEKKEKKEKKIKVEENGVEDSSSQMKIDPESVSNGGAHEIPDSDVLVLEGHDSEVFFCSWNPRRSLLASGSGDSTARIWDIPSGSRPTNSSAPTSIVLNHADPGEDKSKDITTLDWNEAGTLLATGAYDGVARIWTEKGQLRNTLIRHKGPIFSLRWNKSGDYLLSASVDKTAIIWDAKTGDLKQLFEYHTAPTLDVDWRDDVSFASCSTDKLIYVCQLGEDKPIRTFAGHTNEVNVVKWDPSGNFLASCSDDRTAKVWRMDSKDCIYDFTEHEKEIYTIKWSPTGPGSANPNSNLVLATASFDAQVKLWSIETGKCLYSLTHHREPVYSLAFSPDGKYLASGSFDQNLHIWSVKDGSLVKTYKGEGGIFELAWNRSGDKLAACLTNNAVCVLDVRM